MNTISVLVIQESSNIIYSKICVFVVEWAMECRDTIHTPKWELSWICHLTLIGEGGQFRLSNSTSPLWVGASVCMLGKGGLAPMAIRLLLPKPHIAQNLPKNRKIIQNSMSNSSRERGERERPSVGRSEALEREIAKF